MPVTKPYVTGVQAVWIGYDLFQEIREDDVDMAKVAIKGVKAAHKAVDALLTYQGAPDPAKLVNSIAGLCIATADHLYIARLQDMEALKQGGSLGGQR